MSYATIIFHDLDDEADDRVVELSARDVAAIVQGLASRSDEWAAIAVQESVDEGHVRLAREQQDHSDDLRSRLERADEGL